MRVIRIVVALCLVLIVAGIASGGKSEEKLMKEVTAIGDAISKAMVEDDVEFLLGLYAEDAISLPNYGPRMEGLDTFREHHEQMAGAGMKVSSFESEPTEVWECGKQVIEIGKFAIALEMSGLPQPIEDKGKYMTVYVRAKDGSLKVKAEIWNTDMNPMEMGKQEHEDDDEHEHEHE